MRIIISVLVAGALTLGLAVSATAGNRSHYCTYPTTARGNKMTVSCFAKKFGVDASKARYIANRESNFDEYAWNHSSDCRGLYQHKFRYWAGRVHHYAAKLRRWHVKNPVWYNPRAQAVVTFAMVRHGGWAPWGG